VWGFGFRVRCGTRRCTGSGFGSCNANIRSPPKGGFIWVYESFIGFSHLRRTSSCNANMRSSRKPSTLNPQPCPLNPESTCLPPGPSKPGILHPNPFTPNPPNPNPKPQTPNVPARLQISLILVLDIKGRQGEVFPDTQLPIDVVAPRKDPAIGKERQRVEVPCSRV